MELIVSKKRLRNLQKPGIGGFQVRRPCARVRDNQVDINNQQAERGDPSVTVMTTSEKRKPQQRRSNKAKSSRIFKRLFLVAKCLLQLLTPTPAPSESHSLPELSSDDNFKIH